MDTITRSKAARYIIILAIALAALVLAAGKERPLLSSEKIYGKEDISEALLSMGWESDISQLTEQSAVLPEQFDDTFVAYNAIQLKQGCDLSQYAGKQVTVYTVPITNYPDTTDTVLATLIVYKNKLIGGDIHAAAMDGFMLPLK